MFWAEGTAGTKAWRWDQLEELEGVTGLGEGRRAGASSTENDLHSCGALSAEPGPTKCLVDAC